MVFRVGMRHGGSEIGGTVQERERGRERGRERRREIVLGSSMWRQPPSSWSGDADADLLPTGTMLVSDFSMEP